MLEQQIDIDYTNHRGMRSIRTILPYGMWYGHTDYHREEGWFIRAMDLAKGEVRDFYVPDIHAFIAKE